MKLTEAVDILQAFEEQGRCVYRSRDLKKVFRDSTQSGFRSTLKRLQDTGRLTRACRDVYVFRKGRAKRAHLLEEIAATVRRGDVCYVSLESALAEHGLISQIPVNRLTVMTDGRTSEIATPFGVIEFTHSARSTFDLLTRSANVGRPLRLATAKSALADLRRVGRNLHLVDEHFDAAL
ncbi:type IV toxin-antitoxin system AbiEi family antitoxin [Litorivicinus lipolyticus]|uniref:type IV toxin-antitoxin system AbiEi family antitoxin n=1 Tax=Litorivicinus lipolyticus TaxID=418701 RepID=UPI003B59664A